jgi:hypothetical protein
MTNTLAIALAAAASLLMAACGSGVDFDSSVEQPAFRSGTGPKVLFDQGHHNRHKADGSYRPFTELVQNDGFRIDSLDSPFTPGSLAEARILVIVGAQSQTDTNQEPAFTPSEIRSVTDWVRAGGSLLLVTDHYPFPNAAESLANALGLEVGKGMASDEANERQGSKDDTRLIFSRANGLLASNAITNGRNPSESVQLVETFTGDAFKAGEGSAAILKLAPTAKIYRGSPEVTRNGTDVSVNVEFVDPRPTGGWSQGVAFELGRGRVVALAEAAMLTAQEDGGRKLGMNAPGNDNRQFALNVMRWLGRAY